MKIRIRDKKKFTKKIQGAIFLGGYFSGGQFYGGNVPRGNVPGAFYRGAFFLAYEKSVKFINEN